MLQYGGRSVEAVATDMQVQFEKCVLEDHQLHELACKGNSNISFASRFPLASIWAFTQVTPELPLYIKAARAYSEY